MAWTHCQSVPALGSATTMAASEPEHTVMIIRHGEKPAGKGEPYGVSAVGTQDPESLTSVGWARAGALVSLFAPADPALLRRGLYRPQTLFASNFDHGKPGSRRQEQTVSLLARHLGTATDLRFRVGQERELAAAAIQAASPVLICWEHKNIPVLAQAIGPSVPSAPQKWPKERFDVAWVFTRLGGSGHWTFSQVPELLLPGDSAEPIP